jgi:Fur family zinc uptake transcriptional regulator
MSAFPQSRHDHDACAATALASAERIAEERGVRFTALRHYVLEMILASHKPVGAYDVLSALAREDSPAKPSPPTVYRALDFLLAQGFIHRIDSLNAYAGCFAPARAHRSRFLLCRGCGAAAEIDDSELDSALAHAAAARGFAVERQTVELTGLCPECRTDGAAMVK